MASHPAGITAPIPLSHFSPDVAKQLTTAGFDPDANGLIDPSELAAVAAVVDKPTLQPPAGGGTSATSFSALSPGAVDALSDEQQAQLEEERDDCAYLFLFFYNILALLVGLGLVGGSVFAGHVGVSGFGTSVFYTVAASGATLVCVGALGLLVRCGGAGMLMSYFVLATFTAFFTLMVGGFCFVLTPTAEAWTVANWATLYASMTAAQRSGTSLAATQKMITVGMPAFGGVLVFFSLYTALAMRYASQLLSPQRTFILLLQSVNLVLMPMGIALICIGAFTASTIVGSQGPIAAFALFCIGIVVVCHSLVGCFGATLRSRGVLRLFFLLALVIGAGCIAFGVIGIVDASLISTALADNWSSFRALLPPSFAGKYDVGVFKAYMEANMAALGFLALLVGIMQIVGAHASSRLRSELRLELLLEEATLALVVSTTPLGGVVKPTGAAAAAAPPKPADVQSAREMWKAYWVKGSRSSRRTIIIGCSLLCFVILAVLGVAVAALVYSTSCVIMSGASATHLYAELAQSAPNGTLVWIDNRYKRGTVMLAVGNNTDTGVNVTLTKTAWNEADLSEPWPSPQNVSVTITAYVPGSTVLDGVSPGNNTQYCNVDFLGTGVGSTVVGQGLVIVPQAVPLLLGQDASCQNNKITVTLPNSVALAGAPLALLVVLTSSQAGMSVDWTALPVASLPRLRYLGVVSEYGSGSVDLSGMLFGAKGVNIGSSSGSVSLEEVSASCDPNDQGTGAGGVRVSTFTGSLSVSALTSSQCDVVLSTDGAQVSVVGSTVNGLLNMSTLVGTLSISDTNTTALLLSGSGSTITGASVGVSTRLAVVSTLGDITLSGLVLAPRCVGQVESGSGDVELDLTYFVGVVSIVTRGTITCSGAGWDTPTNPCPLQPPTDVNDVFHVVEGATANCHDFSTGSNTCAYSGQLIVTSDSGNVVVKMAASGNFWGFGGR